MMYHRGMLLAVMLLLGAAVSAQPIIYLKKQGTAKTEKIRVGDLVKIKTLSGEKAKGEVLQITPTGVHVGPVDVVFSELAYIRVYDTFTKGAGRSLIYGTFFFGGIFLVNGAITGADPLLTPGEALFAGGFFVVGVLLEMLAQRTYNVTKQWKIQVIMLPED